MDERCSRGEDLVVFSNPVTQCGFALSLQEVLKQHPKESDNFQVNLEGDIGLSEVNATLSRSIPSVMWQCMIQDQMARLPRKVQNKARLYIIARSRP